MQRMWIDGRWTASVSKKTCPIDNPATEEIIDEVPRAGTRDADPAVESAAAAFREWRSVPGIERAARMHEFAARLRANWINDPLTDNDAGPFGGMRLSGIGRELGIEGLDAFREPKHVHWNHLKKGL